MYPSEKQIFDAWYRLFDKHKAQLNTFIGILSILRNGTWVYEDTLKVELKNISADLDESFYLNDSLPKRQAEDVWYVMFHKDWEIIVLQDFLSNKLINIYDLAIFFERNNSFESSKEMCDSFMMKINKGNFKGSFFETTNTEQLESIKKVSKQELREYFLNHFNLSTDNYTLNFPQNIDGLFLKKPAGDITGAPFTQTLYANSTLQKAFIITRFDFREHYNLAMFDSYNATIPKNIQILPKPFLLLSGISGTGKSRFVRLQAEGSCKDDLKKVNGFPENFCLIPVRPDWHEPSDLLGYITRIKGTSYVTTDFLRFIVKAWLNAIGDNGETKTLDMEMSPYWLCLDEMNLAPVEQYFADFLSVIETRKWLKGHYSCNALLKPNVINNLDDEGKNRLRRDLCLDDTGKKAILWELFCSEGIALPPNLIVAGTVNMDETTHGFSRKVIDRALTIDFGEFYPNNFLDFFKQPTRSKLFSFPTISNIEQADLSIVKSDVDGLQSIEFISTVNSVLSGTPFELAYRALNELLVAVACHRPTSLNVLQAVWDDFLMMKVLPRIDGDLDKLRSQKDPNMTILDDMMNILSTKLGEIWEGTVRPDLFRETVTGDPIPPIECRSKKKIKWMSARLDKNGFTSFWP